MDLLLNKPLMEVKSMREVLWAVVIWKNPEDPPSLWVKLYLMGFLVFCRVYAWLQGKNLQQTLKALALTVDELENQKEDDYGI